MLLQCISSEVFVPCLIDLCKALWELMKSYHRTIDWHHRHDDAMATTSPANAAADADAAADGDGDGGLCYCVHLSPLQQLQCFRFYAIDCVKCP